MNIFKEIKIQIITTLDRKYILSWIALFSGLVITGIIFFIEREYVKDISDKEFKLTSLEIKNKIDSRLHSHASILRSGAALFASSDSVTRKEWQLFVLNNKLQKNLPGIQGFGYSILVSAENLSKHIELIRNEGFPTYSIRPNFKRDLYSSIIYLEPDNWRNRRAFGFDMYSEPIRRKAMINARDNDVASISGKVYLVQETDVDKQPGTLMYVPVYKNGMPTNTIDERKDAIKGWVYSPYRMDDLMSNVFNEFDSTSHKNYRIRIYDGYPIIDTNLLFDNYPNENIQKYNLHTQIQYDFNSTIWTLVLDYYDENYEYLSLSRLTITIFSGLIISILIFILITLLTKYKILNEKLLESKNEIDRILINLQKVNKELSFSENELKKSVATKDKLFSIIAHDLKGPIGALNKLAELILSDFQGFNQEDLFKIINQFKNQSEITLHLLINLLDWSRSQENQIKFNYVNFNICNEIENIISLLMPIAQNKNIDLIYHSKGEKLIYADITSINTVFRNLISNAIKFSNKNSKIEIDCKNYPLDQNYYQFEIKDNGIGLSKLQLDEIFENNSINSSIGTNLETGTGLGIIICKEFINNNNGKIWVESTIGKGTTFYFTIPKAK